MATLNVNETAITEAPELAFEVPPPRGWHGLLEILRALFVPGRLRFQLVVEDDSGDESPPVVVEVMMTRGVSLTLIKGLLGGKYRELKGAE